MTILIKNVLCHGKIANILLEKNRIAYIGPQEKKADITIAGDHKAALPTFVNGHTHAAMTLLRGYADDMPLYPWLKEKIWPLEARLTEEDVYWGAKLACLEMIKSGTTLFNDMYWHVEGTARAVKEMGLRAVLSFPLIDFGNGDKRQEQRHSIEALSAKLRDYCSRIRLAIAPHAIYTASPQAIEWAYQFASDRQLLVHTHLAETEQEVKDALAQYKRRPVAHLKSLGALGPALVAAHGVWLEDDELEMIAQAGVHLIHNPVSNMKLAVGGAFRYPEIHKRNISAGLGTDGCASNNNLDMFEQMKFAALLQKWNNDDPTALPCQEVWDMATVEGARIFGLDAGVVAEGKLADLMLVDLLHPQMTPLYHLVSNLVYSAHGDVVDTVICDGQILMQNREVAGESEILAQATAVANKLNGTS